MHTSQQTIRWSTGGVFVVLPMVLRGLMELFWRIGVADMFVQCIGYLLLLAFLTALVASTWITLTAPIPPRRRMVLLVVAWSVVAAQLFWVLGGTPVRSIIWAI